MDNFLFRSRPIRFDSWQQAVAFFAAVLIVAALEKMAKKRLPNVDEKLIHGAAIAVMAVAAVILFFAFKK